MLYPTATGTSAKKGQSIGNGIFTIGGGYTGGGTAQSFLESLNINTTGNSVNFGTLSSPKAWGASAGTSTRFLHIGGWNGASVNTINYGTFATKGNTESFGTFSTALDSIQATGTNTRLFIFGGKGPLQSNFVSTISSLDPNSRGGNTNFGNLSGNRYNIHQAGNSTRIILAGGQPSTINDAANRSLNTIEFFTISSGGNSASFGTLAETISEGRGVASQTRFLSLGGFTFGVGARNTINQINIASRGNGTNFGTLSTAQTAQAVGSTLTRAVTSAGGSVAAISYLTFNNSGNATNFGNLPSARSGPMGAANSHSGLAN
jgi:hypothetical protein